jgi:hypothetical protein
VNTIVSPVNFAIASIKKVSNIIRLLVNNAVFVNEIHEHLTAGVYLRDCWFLRVDISPNITILIDFVGCQ